MYHMHLGDHGIRGKGVGCLRAGLTRRLWTARKVLGTEFESFAKGTCRVLFLFLTAESALIALREWLKRYGF